MLEGRDVRKAGALRTHLRIPYELIPAFAGMSGGKRGKGTSRVSRGEAAPEVSLG